MINDYDINFIEELKRFFLSCDEIGDGKIILADIKISRVLRSIASSQKLYDVIAEDMISFDFYREFAKSKVKNIALENSCFKLPTDIDGIIPLVFQLLVAFDSKSIEFTYFLKTQFPAALNQNDQYNMFAKNVIAPFKNAVAQKFHVNIDEICHKKISNASETNNVSTSKKSILFQTQDDINNNVSSISEEVVKDDKELSDNDLTILGTSRRKIEVETLPQGQLEQLQNVNEDEELEVVEEDEKSQIYVSILSVCDEFKEANISVRNQEKRENIILLICALEEAVKLKKLTIISAIIFALNEVCNKERVLKNYINQLNDLCCQLY